MYPVLFKIGHISIYTFPLILIVVFFSAFFATWSAAKEDDFEFAEIADLFLIIFLAGLVSGRIFEVFLSFSRFSEDLLGIFTFWSHPGFSAWGAIIGGGITCAILARKKRLNILKIFDHFSFGAILALPILFLSHLLSGSYYGEETSFFWGISSATTFGRRHPTAILGFFLFLVVFFVLSKLKKRLHAPGFLFLFGLFSFSLIIFFLEFLRGDVPTLTRKLVNTSFSLVSFSTSVTFLYILSKRKVRADVQLVAFSISKTPGLVFHFITKIIPKRRRVPLRLRRRFF